MLYIIKNKKIDIPNYRFFKWVWTGICFFLTVKVKKKQISVQTYFV